GIGAVNEFVDALSGLRTIFQDVNDGFVAKESAALGVGDSAGIEENHRVGSSGVDVQCARLARLGEKLNHSRQVEVRKASAQTGIGLREHLRGLKTFHFAYNDVADMGSDGNGAAVAVQVVVATGLESLHQSALAAIAHGNDGQGSILGIRTHNACNFQGAHL